MVLMVMSVTDLLTITQRQKFLSEFAFSLSLHSWMTLVRFLQEIDLQAMGLEPMPEDVEEYPASENTSNSCSLPTDTAAPHVASEGEEKKVVCVGSIKEMAQFRLAARTQTVHARREVSNGEGSTLDDKKHMSPADIPSDNGGNKPVLLVRTQTKHEVVIERLSRVLLAIESEMAVRLSNKESLGGSFFIRRLCSRVPTIYDGAISMFHCLMDSDPRSLPSFFILH